MVMSVTQTVQYMSYAAKYDTVPGLFESLTIIMAAMILYEPYMQIRAQATTTNKWIFFEHSKMLFCHAFLVCLCDKA